MPWRYDGADSQVEVIVEPEFKGDLLALATKRRVWIVETPQNRPQIDASWRVGEHLNLFEVSRCGVENPNDREGNLLTILGALDDHKGAYDLIVHGLEPSDSLEQIMEAEGFRITSAIHGGFLAVRIPGARERLIGR
jgi:hypothetical protein